MEDKIKARKTDELQTQFIKLTDEFIAALDTGTPFSQLQSLRDKIRLLSKVLDARKLSGH